MIGPHLSNILNGCITYIFFEESFVKDKEANLLIIQGKLVYIYIWETFFLGYDGDIWWYKYVRRMFRED